MTFGEYLKSTRKGKKMTLRELAEKSDSSNSYLSQLETGKRNPPKPSMMRNIAFALGDGVVEQIDIYKNMMICAGYLSDDSERVIG